MKEEMKQNYEWKDMILSGNEAVMSENFVIVHQTCHTGATLNLFRRQYRISIDGYVNIYYSDDGLII